jgi:hypothetical protein
MSVELIGTWIAAFLTLCLFSFLYKDNPFFRFAEALFAGVSLGYYIGQTANNTLKPNLVLPLVHDFRSNFDLVIPALLGLNLYTRYIPRIAWMARFSLAVYVGYYTGVTMVQKLQGEVLPQAGATMMPLLGAFPIAGATTLLAGLAGAALVLGLVDSARGRMTRGAAAFVSTWIVLRVVAQVAFPPAADALDNLLMFVGVLMVLVYFFFSLEHRGAVGGMSRLGIWFLMLGFGAAFGYTVMGRVSLLIGRMNFLVIDWIGGTLRAIGS